MVRQKPAHDQAANSMVSKVKLTFTWHPNSEKYAELSQDCSDTVAPRISWVRLETPRGDSKRQEGHTKLRCRQNGKSQGSSVNVGKARLVTARAERPVFTQILEWIRNQLARPKAQAVSADTP